MRRLPVLLGSTLLALVTLAAPATAGGGGGCHDREPTEEATTTVVMEDLCIRPGVVHVEPGATVTIENRDPMLHNLYGVDWFHGDLQPGDRATRTFSEPGTYAFTCTLHPGMVGAVVVGDAELAASSREPDAGGLRGGAAVALAVGGAIALAAVFAGGLTAGRRRT